jgi:CysZ protein
VLIQAVTRSFEQVTSPPFRAIVWKSLALTLVLLALVWLALTRLLNWWLSQGAVVTDHPMIATIAAFMAGAGLFIGLAFLIAPVSILVASFFADDIAARIEQEDYPLDPPGQPPPIGRAVLDGLKLALLALGVNLVALFLLLLPGINVVAFLLANTFLLGREYFNLAAGRFMPPDAVKALRETNRFAVYFAGFIMALMLGIPLLNLFAPVFGTALFVHVNKALMARRSNS